MKPSPFFLDEAEPGPFADVLSDFHRKLVAKLVELQNRHGVPFTIGSAYRRGNKWFVDLRPDIDAILGRPSREPHVEIAP